MKTFKKTYLPEVVKYSGKNYERGEKTDKSIKVEVLSRNLRGRTDLFGREYTPTVWFFNPVKH